MGIVARRRRRRALGPLGRHHPEHHPDRRSDPAAPCASPVPDTDRPGIAGDGGSGGARRRHGDAGPHARPARAAADLRLQGRGLDRRNAAPCRTAAAGRTTPVRGDVRRRCRDVRVGGRARAGDPGTHGGASRHAADAGAGADDNGPSGGICRPARVAGRDLRQDRAGNLHADENRVRRSGGTVAARNGRQLHHAAEAQSATLPGHHRRSGGTAIAGAAGAGGGADRARGRPHQYADDA